VPEDSVLLSTDLSSSATSQPTPNLPPPSNNALLSFPSISRFLIPKPTLRNKIFTLTPQPLTPSTPPLILLYLPTHIVDPKTYLRNEFIYTITLILDPAADIPSYKSVLSKLTSLLTSLESQSQYLSSDTSPPNSGPIYSLLETLMEDLNSYAEAMIPINPLNTLNIKLFPTLPSPPKIMPWHVPLFLVQIQKLLDPTWDLTIQRIIPFINGVNSVKRIAYLADADIKLTRKAVRHLVYYGCLMLLDIFSFNNIYAPTSDFTSTITRDEGMQRECARYVNLKFSDRTTLPGGEEAVLDGTPISTGEDVDGGERGLWPVMRNGEAIDGVGIVQMFAKLSHGRTVREWVNANADMLASIDVRRFITFGVIKGFLYRVHRYAIRTKRLKESSKTGQKEGRRKKNMAEIDRQDKIRERDGDEDELDDGHERLLDYLDGTHCFDEICTDLETSERELIKRLESGEFGEVVIICR
jgi:nitrogen permease regulator 2-like protein